MAQTSDSSLEQRLLDLEAAVRALRAANPFGLVAVTDDALVELLGTASTVGGVDWVTGPPYVTLYLSSSRLHVEAAAALVAAGNKCSAYMSWRCEGPSDLEETATAGLGAVAVAPDYTRAVEVQHSHSGQDQRAAAATFGIHTGLEPGWYRIAGQYALSYSSTTAAPYGGISNRRIAAMPF